MSFNKHFIFSNFFFQISLFQVEFHQLSYLFFKLITFFHLLWSEELRPLSNGLLDISSILWVGKENRCVRDEQPLAWKWAEFAAVLMGGINSML